MKSKVIDTVIVIVVSILIAVVPFILYIKYMDSIPVDIQTLSFLGLFMVLTEGLGLSAVADYEELERTFLIYIPFIRHYKLGEIVQYAGYELLGKIRLTLIAMVLTIISVVGAVLTEPGTLKAVFLIAVYVSILLLVIFKTIYLFLLTKKLNGIGMAVLTLLIVPQPFITIAYRKKIKELSRNNNDYDEEDYEYDDNTDYEEEYEEED